MQILHQSTNGITAQQIAEKCEVGVRTTYRDLQALENELGLPVWEHKGKRGITENVGTDGEIVPVGDMNTTGDTRDDSKRGQENRGRFPHE